MEKVECIVVGGGLAGLSAAYGLASEGLEVMVLERGDFAGAKNVTGGRLYVSPIRGMYPELWKTAAGALTEGADGAPFERPVVCELLTMMSPGEQTTIEIASDRFGGAGAGIGGTRPQSYTVLRARLDQWLAEKVTEKGAMVVPKMKVDELLVEPVAEAGAGAAGLSSGPPSAAAAPPVKVVGIRAGGDEIGADVVVVAEGALGLLSSAAWLRERPQPEHYALGYKEVIELPPGTIEDRWHLDPGEGAAQLFMGSLTKGMTGGGFLYTNRDSVSLGIVVAMHQMKSRPDELESWQLLDEFKEVAHIRPLLAGGTVAEYSAHAIPEGGMAQVPRLCGDGYVLVGDAAGLALNALVTVRGMDFAIASGYYAAKAIAAAKKAGDLSAVGLSSYEAFLRASFVLQDLQTARAYPGLIENPRLFTRYPELVSRLLRDLYTVGPGPTPGLVKKALRNVRGELLRPSTWRDAWRMRKL
ncbi:MAG TPA: FAD-dependent oxidoreductase [Thermoleophilia bacterium]|nr:FAD-dependent oxidoreductase [Thermoleophilia bacterium]